MPIYEYRCQACGETFEYMQRMSDDPKTTCESCGGELERLISASAFTFKGGGWYKDLYASPKPDSGGSKEGGGEAKPKEGQSGSQGDSKTGATSDPGGKKSKKAAD